ncbi:conjugal transfer protein TrbE [Escherichia coli]
MMKVIFTSNRFIDFLIRLLITAIVISPVIIWSWDTVETRQTGCLPLLSLSFTPVCSCLFCILFFCPD